MDLALQRWLPKLAYCRSIRELEALAIDGSRQCFGSHAVCAIRLDDAAAVRGRTIFGLRDDDFDEWAHDWRPEDRVFLTAIASAAPTHRGQLYSDEQWRALPIFIEYGQRLNIDHYLAVPMYGSRGRLIGMVTLCRRRQDRAFDGRSMALASTFTGFLSATLARLGDRAAEPEGALQERLTARELQMARLATAGRNNLQIALELGVARETVKQTLRRVYSKLGVSGRAPMAAKLSSLGWDR